MKKTIIILTAIILLIIAVVLIFRQPKPAAGITFFFGQECPHCAKVEQWMADNKIEEKVKIDKKEVYHNQSNATELGKAAIACGKDTSSLGVPFLYDGKSCYEGEEEVMNYLNQYLGK
jgi:uncharacterized protein YxeA